MASNPSIYDQLVQEHGDVVSEAREAADRTRRQADSVLDWSGTGALGRRPGGSGPVESAEG